MFQVRRMDSMENVQADLAADSGCRSEYLEVLEAKLVR